MNAQTQVAQQRLSDAKKKLEQAHREYNDALIATQNCEQLTDRNTTLTNYSATSPSAQPGYDSLTDC